MTEKAFYEIRDLWKLIQAEISIQQAIDSVTYIVANKLDQHHPLYYPLLSAIYTLYARPFTDNDKVGMLSEDIIPAKGKLMHKELMLLRHGLFAHTDTHKLKSDKFGPVLQAWFKFEGEAEPKLFTTSIELPREKLEIVGRYFVAMSRLIHEKMAFRLHAYLPQRPQADGEYLLNIYDINGPVWITHAESLRYLSPDATTLNIVLPPAD